MVDREDLQRVLLTKHDMKSNEMSSVCMCVLDAYGRRGYRGGVNMLKTSALVQPIFLYIVLLFATQQTKRKLH